VTKFFDRARRYPDTRVFLVAIWIGLLIASGGTSYLQFHWDMRKRILL
jgi:hypothetical protein